MFIKQSILALLMGAALATAKESPSAALVTEVPFDQASAELRSDGKQNLTAILNEAKKKGEVLEVKIISWADGNYPKPPKDKLGKDARKLADERGLEVAGFFQDRTTGFEIKTYNMAERPNEFEKLLKTSDARVKEAIEAKKNLAHVSSALVVVVIK